MIERLSYFSQISIIKNENSRNPVVFTLAAAETYKFEVWTGWMTFQCCQSCVRFSVWIHSNVWGHFNNRSSQQVEESSRARCSSRSRFTPVSVSKYSPFVAVQFRETKGHVTETWRSTSAGICAPPFATMRSSTHRWVSTIYRSERLMRPG